MNSKPDFRIAALRRFATAITLVTVLGHAWLGFEQAVIHVLAALATAYVVECILEVVSAEMDGRPRRFAGNWLTVVDFFLPAHITGMACAMLLYPNARIWPIVFAVTVAIGSKAIIRVRIGERTRHMFNPSNTGIAATLLFFPWVGIAPPYQFTETTFGPLDWIIPGIIVLSGSLINTRYTGRMPLILGWLAGFAAQAIIRALLFGTAIVSGLVPMTGMAFLLFTFYMISDPGTTPMTKRSQVAFGLGCAAVYGLLLWLHVVFTLFFALVIACAVRGIYLATSHRLANRRTARVVYTTSAAVHQE